MSGGTAVGGGWVMVRTLARADGPKLLVNLWFLVGVGIALLGSGIFLKLTLSDGGAAWDDDAWTVQAGFLLLAIFAMLAANTATLRDHREGMEEQQQALPTTGSVRVTGLNAAMLWPAAASTLLLASVATFAALRMDVPGAICAYIVHNAVLVLMMGSLGVALGVWVRTAFAAPVLAFMMYLVHPSESPAAWQVVWPFAAPRATWMEVWHIVYLLGVTLLLMGAAQSRWGRSRGTAGALVVGCGLVGVAIAVMTTYVCPQTGPCGF